MCLLIGGINYAPFYDVAIGFWICSHSVVFFCFSLDDTRVNIAVLIHIYFVIFTFDRSFDLSC